MEEVALEEDAPTPMVMMGTAIVGKVVLTLTMTTGTEVTLVATATKMITVMTVK